MQDTLIDRANDKAHTTPLVPPLNFALVEAGVYRSGHPNPKNYCFLEKLGLRTIVFLAKDAYPDEMQTWVASQGISLFQYRTAGNKEPFTEMHPERVAELLGILLDTRNHPVLVHCNKGKHRVGCLVGCLRKLQNWSLTSILDEYKRFAAKQNIADEEFIELFSTAVERDVDHLPSWLWAHAPRAHV